MIRWSRCSPHPNKSGVWIRLDRDWPSEFQPTLDQDLDDRAAWCHETKCGRRMAYDMFQFKTEAELTAFMLRWS